MEVWRVLESGEAEGYLNMAIDEAILWSCQKGYTPPTLRFYRWSRPTLSIGYSQKVFKEFDVAACQELRYPIVRRITGGRAVLHDKEVTYSIVIPKGDPLFPASVLQGYRALGVGLRWGCNMLGLEVQVVSRSVGKRRAEGSVSVGHVSSVSRSERTNPRSCGKSPWPPRSPICFSSPSWYEIVAGGKKLIGSAQRRLDNALLQQGSILMKFNPEPLAAVLPIKSKAALKEFADRITSITDLLKKEISYQQVVSAMVKGFEQGCGITFQKAPLTPLEWKIAYQLYRTKYSQDMWNYRV